MTRSKELIELLKNLNFLLSDLISIIIDYDQIGFPIKPTQIWSLQPTDSVPHGIISDQKFLYVCDNVNEQIKIYNFEGQKIRQPCPSFNSPSGIDFYENSLYIIETGKVSICNLQLNILFSFYVPNFLQRISHIKVDQNLIYITTAGFDYVYTYTQEGEFKLKLDGFNEPRGLAFDDQSLYICDCDNHQIQLLNKKHYSKKEKWGKVFLLEIFSSKSYRLLRNFSLCG